MKIDNKKYDEIKSCILCNSSSNVIAVDNIVDNVGEVNNYSGTILECVNCKHAYLSPRPNVSYIHEAYAGYYTQKKSEIALSKDKFFKFKSFYDLFYHGRYSLKGVLISILSILLPFIRFFLKRAARFLPKYDKNMKPKLLDVGCGSGDFLLRASYCGYDVFGIDFDPTTIEIAKSRGLNASVINITDIEDDDLYDVIVLSHVIEHVEDPVLLVESIYKKLKPGGYFYVATPNFDSAGRHVFKSFWRGVDAPRHMHYFNIENLRGLLSKTGFVKITQVYDLPQSVGVIKSSFKLKFIGKLDIMHYFKYLFMLLKMKFYSPKHLEVAVFKCYKSS